MTTALLVLAATLGVVLATPALAQSGASITTTPDGRLIGSASAGAAPPVSVEAGGGRTRVEDGPPSSAYGSGRSVTVQGPNGSASAGAWSSGVGPAAVYASGSPGSEIRHGGYGREDAYAYGRSGHHHHRHWRRRHRP